MAAEIDIEVVCALPGRQHLLRLRVPEGCTAREAVRHSAIADLLPELDVEHATLGVFGRVLANPCERVLKAGERVEVYRALVREPQAARRQRARR